jgi:hypothetical protein
VGAGGYPAVDARAAVAGVGGPLLHLRGQRERRQREGHPVQRAGPALLGGLDLVPVRRDRPGVGGIDVADELAELREAIDLAGEDRADEAVAGELGDVLFAVVRLARALDVDAEDALRGATGRFADRVRVAERLAAGRGLDLTAIGTDERAELWAEAKRSVG